jgi:hypothetical protein
MIKRIFYILLGLLFIVALLCKSNICDGNNMPFGLIAFDVYVNSSSTDKELFAGTIKVNYFSKHKGLKKALALADSYANAMNLTDWSYVCCTVTASSNCVTKIR